MSTQNARKFGFFSALTMVIGSVVGIGIFIKNDGIFEITDGNGIATLLAWIVGGVLALLTALSFSEISKSGLKSNGGLGEYAEKYVGRRFGSVIKLTYPLLYWAILAPALSYFSYIFLTIATKQDPTYIGMIIAVIFGPLTLGLITVYTEKFSKSILSITTIIKFIPLIIAVLIGLFTTSNGGGIIKKLPNLEGITDDGYTYSKSTMDGMLLALPSVLFAYDAFLGVGSISKNTKNAERTIPLAVIIGMSVITVMYTLITISQLNQNSGSISATIEAVLKTDVLSSVVSLIIVISAIGTTNAVTIAAIYSTKDLVESKRLPFLKTEGKDSLKVAATLFSVFAILFGVLFVFSTIAINKPKSDVLNAMSNQPTLFFFLVYAVVITGYTIHKFKSKSIKGAWSTFVVAASIISAIGIVFVVGYQFFNLFKVIIEDGFAPTAEAGVNNASLILFPILMYVLPVTVLFMKKKFEENETFLKSIGHALILKF